MCPACMTTAAILATGATSAGGLVGVFAVKLRKRERERARRSPKLRVPREPTKGND